MVQTVGTAILGSGWSSSVGFDRMNATNQSVAAIDSPSPNASTATRLHWFVRRGVTYVDGSDQKNARRTGQAWHENLGPIQERFRDHQGITRRIPANPVGQQPLRGELPPNLDARLFGQRRKSHLLVKGLVSKTIEFIEPEKETLPSRKRLTEGFDGIHCSHARRFPSQESSPADAIRRIQSRR